MQTATEQLMIALYEGGYLRGNGNEMDDILEKYKEVFKEQIIDAYQAGDGDAYNLEETEDWAKQYYNETYGSKRSDEIEFYKKELEDEKNRVTSTLKGQLYLKSQPKGWFVVYDIDGFTKAELPINPKYEKYYFLDEEDEGKEVEFEIIKYDGKNKISEGWNEYAKLKRREMIDEIEKAEITSSQTEISDEEIENEAERYEKVDGINSFKEAIKWYREQLKKK